MSSATPARPQANILLVDDRPENLLALEAILEPLGERLVRCESGEEALRAMLHDEFACILLDVQMPGMDGYETAALIKARERTRHVPIIFLTAIDTDDRAARRGYGAGAVDYLFKPFDPVVLRSKVTVFIDLFHLKREAEDLAHRALHDPLTGLPNRVLFRDRLELAIARTRRLPSSVGIFYIDLDDFKPVNDSLGHEAGDDLLVTLAQRLSGVLRPADTVARLGGDEFAVLSDAIEGEEGAGEIAERMIAVISEPFATARGTAQVSASIGIALAGDPVDPERLLREADECMYAAKAAGGATWRLGGGKDAGSAGPPRPSRLDFELGLVPRIAVDGSSAGRAVVLRGSDGGVLDVDGLDAAGALRALREGLALPSPEEPVAVPFGRVLLDDLAGDVREAIADAAPAPGSHWLEVSDASLAAVAPEVVPALQSLAAGRGLGLAVRGAGTGGAALATLSRLPLEALVLAPGLDDATTRATVAVAHALGAVAVATEVEDEERLELVRALGCDVAEGSAAHTPALRAS